MKDQSLMTEARENELYNAVCDKFQDKPEFVDGCGSGCFYLESANRKHDVVFAINWEDYGHAFTVNEDASTCEATFIVHDNNFKSYEHTEDDMEKLLTSVDKMYKLFASTVNFESFKSALLANDYTIESN